MKSFKQLKKINYKPIFFVRGYCTQHQNKSHHDDPNRERIQKFVNYAKEANRNIPEKEDLSVITKFQTYAWSGFAITLMLAGGIVWFLHIVKPKTVQQEIKIKELKEKTHNELEKKSV